MDAWLIILIVFISLLVLILTTALVCFFMVFYAKKDVKNPKDEFPVPDDKIYGEYRDLVIEWIKWARSTPHTDVAITSFDGLRLVGKFYEYKKGAPIEIMFHGYKGTAERDMSGGVIRAFALGRSALIVDHRAAGSSEGRVITFGASESRDALSWVDFVVNEIDPDAKIILTGISMGAATVMIASAMPLPKNVIGVLADCGYTSTKAIIKKVIRDMKLPPDFFYPFVKLGAILFGRFNPDRLSPIKAMKDCQLPIIFYHGDADDFVPFAMSEENYRACISNHKELIAIRGAGHGLSFPADQTRYLDTLRTFFKPYLQTDTTTKGA